MRWSGKVETEVSAYFFSVTKTRPLLMIGGGGGGGGGDCGEYLKEFFYSDKLS